MYLLALDASSTEIGYSIINKDNKDLIFAGHLSMPSDLNLLEKAKFFEKFLISGILKEYPLIDEMIIEKPYEAMFGGGSTSKTTTLLNKINFAYQYISYSQGLKVNELSVSECRKFAYPGVKFGKEKDEQKEKIFEIVKSEIGEKFFSKKELKRNSKKGNKGDMVWEEWCYDITDSYVVGKAFINLMNLGLTIEKVKELNEEKKLKLKNKKKIF